MPEIRCASVDDAEAVAALSEISDTASRILTSFTPAIPDRTDVVWLEHEDLRGSPRPVLRVAPLSVAALLRDQVFPRSTTVFTKIRSLRAQATSATLCGLPFAVRRL